MTNRIRSMSVLNKGLTVFLSVLMVFTMGPWTQVVEANAEEIKAAQTATIDAATADATTPDAAASDLQDAAADAAITGDTAAVDETTTDAAAADVVAIDAAATTVTTETTTDQAATTGEADATDPSLEPQVDKGTGAAFPTPATDGDTFTWSTNNVTYTYYGGTWYPEEIVDGSFAYPDASSVISSSWIYIDSANGGYRTQGKNGTFSPFVSQSFDWYSGEAAIGAISKFVELNTDTSNNSYNQYAELCAQTSGLSIYQDVATVPNALYKWSLKHASMYPTFVDQMQVKIGTTASQVAQTATRTSTNGASFTGRSTGGAGISATDTNQVGFSGTTIETPTAGTTSGSHRTSHAANNDWETYVGTYMVPSSQTITRFTFQNVASAGAQEGNHLDDITFKISYPLYYNVNGGSADRGNGIPYCGPDTNTSSYQNYFYSGSTPTLATLGTVYSYSESSSGTDATCTVNKSNLTHDSMPTSTPAMADGTTKSIADKVIPLGWSKTASGVESTKEGIAGAGIVTNYTNFADSGTDNVVYAVWAQDHTLYFDKNTTDTVASAAPDDQEGEPSYDTATGTAAYSTSIDPSSATPWKDGSTTLRDGYIFEGWYTDAACTKAYTFGDAIEADTHLYAKWTPLVTVSKTLTSVDYSANPATASYTFTVKNNSGVDVTNFTFTDTIDENLTYVDGSVNGATTNDGGKTFTVANIGKKGSATDTVKVTASFNITEISKEFANSAAGNGKPTSALTKTAYSDPGCEIPLADGASLMKGQTVYYKIVRTNTSTTSALAGATVTDTLSDGLTCADATISDTKAGGTVSHDGTTITWSAADLAAKGSSNMVVTVTVDADATVSTVTNTVTDGFETVVVSNPLPSISLSKTLTSVSGNIATYTITATNSGHLAATNHTFTEDYGENLTYKSVGGDATADNEAGSSFTFASIPAATFDASGTMTAAGTATATITCTVKDTSKSFLNTAAGLDASNAGLTKVAFTDAACNNALGDSPVYPGETIYYKLTRSNTGAGLLAAGTVTDTLGAGLTFVSATPATRAEIDGSATVKGQVVTWDVPAITADQATASIVIKATVDEGDYEYVTNSATDGHTTVVVTNFEPHVAVVKTIAQVSDVDMTDKTVTYTFTFTNNSFEAYTGYTFTENFGSNLTYKEASGATPTDATDKTFTLKDPVPAAKTADGVVTPGNATATITFNITDTSKSFLNNATGAGTSDATLEKVAYTDAACTTPLGDAAVYPGETIYYKLTRANTGDDALAAGTVTDTLGTGLAYVSATGDGTAKVDGQVVTWSVPELEKGGSASIVVTAIVDATGTDAQGNAITYDYVTNSASDGHNTTVVSNPELHVTISKTLTSVDYAKGTATYSIAVTNSGKADATNYSFTDDFGTNLTYDKDVANLSGATTTDGKTFTIAALPANDTVAVSVTYKIIDTSKAFTNNATGSGTGDATLEKVAYTDAACTTPLGDAAVYPGETIYYKLTRAGKDGAALAAGTVTDTLGAGLAYVSATPVTSVDHDGAVLPEDNVLLWVVPDVAEKDSANMVIKVTVVSGDYDHVSNSATDGHNTVVVDNPEPHVTVSKTLTSVDLREKTATYTITVANSAAVAANSYVFTEDYGSNLTYQGVTGATANDDKGTSFTVASVPAATTVDKVVKPGTSIVTVTFNITDPSKSFLNNATGAGTSDATLEKVAYTDAACTTPLGDAAVYPGETVYYKLTRANTGDDALAAGTVTDTLGAGLTYVSATPVKGAEADGTAKVDGQVVTWSVPEIEKGGSANIVVAAKVVSGDYDHVSNSATDGHNTVVVTNPEPHVIAVKTLETCDLKAKTATYLIVATNSGDASANGYVVTENFGTNLTDMSLGDVTSSDESTVTATASGTASGSTITFSSIPAGATVKVPVTLKITNVSEPIKNELVTPVGGYGDAALDKAIYSDEACTQQIAAGTSLDKGQTVYYKITRTDTSKTDDLAAGLVEDMLSAGLTYVSATPSDDGKITYDSGEHAVFWDAATITHNTDGNANSTLVVRCTVNSSGDFDVVTNSVSDGARTVVVTNPVANISISKQLTSTDLASATPTATYTISVHNSGAGGVSGYQVNVTDIADSNLTYQGVTGATTPAEGDPNHGKVFSVDVVAGATAEVVITFKVNDVTKAFTNSAYTDANDGATLTKVAYYDEACTQAVGTGAVYAGQTIYYKLTRTNTSTTTDLPAGTVTDTLGAGLTFVDAKASDGGEVSVSGQVVTWKAAAIKHNATGDAASTLVVAAAVDAPGMGAWGSYDAVSNSATDGTHTTVVANREAQVSITKILDSVDYAKKTATYKIALINFGAVAATNYTFTEDYGDNLTYQSSSCPQAMKVSDDGKTFTVATVPPMKNSSDFISVTITCAIGDVAKPFTNKAIATDVPDFALTKTAYTDAGCTHELGTNAVFPGQTIYYKITRTNTSTTSTLPKGEVTEAPGTGITVVGTPMASDGAAIIEGVDIVTGEVCYVWFAKAIAPNTAGDASSYMVITATVDATGTDAQGNVVTYDAVSNSATDDTHTTVVTNPETRITATKALTSYDLAKSTATYTITVENTGSAPAVGYALTEDFGANLKDMALGDVSVSGSTAAVMATASGTTSGSTITFDTLPAGATVTVPVTFTVADASKGISNELVTPDGPYAGSALTKVAYYDWACTRAIPDGAALDRGQTVYYKVTRTNTSTTADLAAGTVTDTLGAGLTYVAAIASGSKTISVSGQTVTWGAAAIPHNDKGDASSTLVVAATVGTASTVSSVSNSVTDGTHTVVVTHPVANVTVDKSLTSTSLDTDPATATYAIVVTNHSSVALDSYTFTEDFGANLKDMTLGAATVLGSTQAVGATADGNAITVGPIPGSSSVRIPVTFTVKDTSVAFKNTAKTNETSESTLDKKAYSDPECTQEITDADTVYAGQPIYYKVTRTNTSKTTDLAADVVTDTIGAGLTFVSASSSDAASGGTVGEYDSAARSVTWQAAAIAHNDTGDVSSSLTICCSVDATGTYDVVSNAACDSSHTVVVTNPISHVTLDKTLDSYSLQDKTATYKVKLTNTGKTDTGAYSFQETYLSGNLKDMVVTQATDVNGVTASTDGITVTVTKVPAGQTVTVTISFTIVDTSNEFSNGVVEAYDAHSSLGKGAFYDAEFKNQVGDGDILYAGQTIYYKVVRVNMSTTADLAADVVTDTLGAGLTFVSASSSDAASGGTVGEYDSAKRSVTWNAAAITHNDTGDASSYMTVVATVDTTGTFGTVTNRASDGYATVVITDPVGHAAISKTLTSSNLAADPATATYTIHVENTDKVPLVGYTFTDDFGTNLVYDKDVAKLSGATTDDGKTFTVSDVAAGGSIDVVVTYKIIDTGKTFRNSATAPDASPNVTLDKTLQVKDANGNWVAAADTTSLMKGQEVRYLVTVTNSGTAEAASRTVTETAGADLTITGATADNGTVAATTAGKAYTWTTGTITAASATADTVYTMTVDATVDASATADVVSNSATDGSNTTVITNPLPSVIVSKELVSADLGTKTATYKITVTNTGKGDAENYVFTEQPSDNLTNMKVTQATDTEGVTASADGNAITVSKVAAGTTVKVTVTFDIADTSKAFDNAVVSNPWSSAGLSKVAYYDAACTQAIPAGAAVLKGQTIYYKVERTNTSTTDKLAGATITDTASTGLTVVGATATDGTTPAVSGQTITWQAQELAANASSSMVVTCTVNSAGSFSTVSNSATDGNRTVVVTNEVPSITVTKVLTNTDLAAKTATYDIVVTNNGTGDANGYTVHVTDVASDNLTFKSISDNATDVASDGSSFEIDVAAGKTVHVTTVYTINDVSKGFTNHATVNPNEGETLTKQAFDPAGNEITNGTSVHAGEVITYKVTRTNTSTTTVLPGATIVDTLTTGLTYVEDSAAATDGGTVDVKDHEVSWTSADLNAKGSATLTLKAVVDQSGTVDIVSNSVTDGTHTDVVTNPVAKVTLKKAISSITYAADGSATATYKITLSNVGNGTVAAGYRFSDTMINGTVDAGSVTNATYDQGQNAFVTTAAIASGGSLDVTVIAKVDASAAARQSSNQAAPADSAWTLSKTRVAGLSSTDTSSDDSMLSAGSKVFYKLTIDNSNGTVALPASVTATTESFKNLAFVTAEDGSGNTVDLVKNADGTYTWNAGEIASKATANVWLEFTVNADVSTTAPAFVVENTASAYDHTVVTSSPVVEVTAVKSASKITYNSDTTATVAYSIAVENKGATPAVDYVLSDVATNGAVEAGSVKGATYDAVAGTFTIASLAAGEKTTVTYTATVDKTALSQSNKVRPLSPGMSSDWELLKDRVDADGSTTVATSLLSPGDTAWYLLTIDNSMGSEPINASDAIVTDTFANLTYVATGTVTQGDVDATTAGSSTITWNAGDVAAGDVAYAWVEFTVADSATADSSDENYATAINAAEASSHNVTHVDPVAKPTTFDPPAQKIISGDTPSSSSEFTFRMTAGSDTTPMPNGQVGGSETTAIAGAGLVEFGTMEYAKAGTYTYTLAEEVGSVDGYTYDTTIYTLTVTVVADATNQLVATGVVTDADGNTVDVAKFTNAYTAPAVPVSPVTPATASTTPKTGDSSWTGTESAALASLAAGMVAVAWVIRRRNDRNGSLR